MGADLQIHVLDGATEAELAEFQSSTLGSDYFSWNRDVLSDRWDELFDKIGNTPSVWVGEVSWLKAGLTGDGATYIPSLCEAVSSCFEHDLMLCDEAFIARMEAAIAAAGPNSTSYKTAPGEEVLAFLRAHKGKRVFTISW